MPCCGPKKPNKTVFSNKDEQDAFEKMLEPFQLREGQLLSVMTAMDQAMTRGMNDTIDEDVRMFPTYIKSVPNSKETGKFLSLELGIHKVIVSYVELKGKHIAFNEKYGTPVLSERASEIIFTRDLSHWSSSGFDSRRDPIAYESMWLEIGNDVKRGSGEQLFQFLVDALKQFIKHSGRVPEAGDIHLGFTFPSPVRKTGPQRGILTNWTKDFNCDGVEGKDVAMLLQEKLNENGLSRVKVNVLLNDTLALFMAGAYGPASASVQVGVILGYGTNAVYQEDLDKIPSTQYHGEQMAHYKAFRKTATKGSHKMIIDTEWGALGESPRSLDFLKTRYDIAVDKASQNPGKDVLAKLMCGLYIRKLACLIFEELQEKKLMLKDHTTDIFKIMSSKLNVTQMYQMNVDRGITFSTTRKILADAGLHNVEISDLKIFKRVSEVLTTRSAFLAAAGIATIVAKIPREKVTVVMDGSLVRAHPFYIHHLESMMETLMKVLPRTILRNT